MVNTRHFYKGLKRAKKNPPPIVPVKKAEHKAEIKTEQPKENKLAVPKRKLTTVYGYSPSFFSKKVKPEKKFDEHSSDLFFYKGQHYLKKKQRAAQQAAKRKI